MNIPGWATPDDPGLAVQDGTNPSLSLRPPVAGCSVCLFLT